MDILNEHMVTKDGNDCLITDAVALIRVTDDAYIVTFTEAVRGGWTGNPTTTTCESFRNYNDAKNHFSKVVKKVG